MTDICWQQRFQNYASALVQLDAAVELLGQRALSDLENQGLIQAFEYTYELAWSVIKDFYAYQGETDIQGSRDAFRIAYQRGLIGNGDAWMDMIKSRALTSHTYNKSTAQLVIAAIKERYIQAFKNLAKTLEAHFE